LQNLTLKVGAGATMPL